MNPLPNHGTKILGAIMTVLGAIAAATPDSFGKYGPAIVMAAGGLLTILRGFQNTANSEDKK